MKEAAAHSVTILIPFMKGAAGPSAHLVTLPTNQTKTDLRKPLCK
jgi:hypothetical protein